MAERRRNRKKKEQTEASEDNEKPSKEEYAIAKYMRQKLPEKKTMLLGHKVDYFIAARAIDCLLDSPWATKTGKQEAIFTHRESCIEMMDKMLQHKFFHRAKKIVVQKDSKKKKKEKDEDTAAESGKEKKEKEKKKEKETKVEEEAAEKTEEKKEGEKEEKKKEKKKIKLDMHMEQVFIDGNEAYVWIYDPIPMRTWIIGMLMVLGAVLVCLFPLWPQSIRHYIYYLSVAAAFFLVFIIGLAILRLVVFVLIWAITLGHHHLWLLPNLTEDVGFFESFWPLYHYEYRGAGAKPKKKESKKGKDKKTDEEEEEKDDEKSTTKETKEENEEKSDSGSEQETKKDQTDSEESEQDSEDAQKEKTEKDDDGSNAEKEKNENGDNGFEILDPEDDVVTAHNNNNNNN